MADDVDGMVNRAEVRSKLDRALLETAVPYASHDRVNAMMLGLSGMAGGETP